MVVAPIFIFIVCSNTFQLQLCNFRLSFKYEIVGMEVELGHPSISNSERQGGNDGSKRWCGSSSSSSSEFLHHPFKFGQSKICRKDKDGKNGVFEEEEEEPLNTLLTQSSSDMYSSAAIN